MTPVNVDYAKLLGFRLLKSETSVSLKTTDEAAIGLKVGVKGTTPPPGFIRRKNDI
ncbi:MAG: hypothetical protein ACSHXH_16075 [Marivita sp.]|uniref:hypothetical protein n=1 Tax=Marivita sp. TaxID=2003365 RepID=UPI003EF243CE